MLRAYLPSKRIWILIGVIIALGVGIYVYTKNSPNEATGLITAAEKEQLQQTDTDGDGLSDWEESLWGTDPTIADSDGDGTTDGVEVAEGRDPNTAGPDDRLTTAVTTSTSTSETNLTASVEREVLPRGLVLAVAQQEGEQISDEDIRRVAGSVTTQIDTSVDLYTRADLNVTELPAPTQTQAQAYLDNLFTALDVGATTIQRDPLEVVAIALQNNEAQEVDLTPYIHINQKIASQLLAVRVPSAYASEHLSIVNSIQKEVTALRRLQVITTDPIRGVVAVQQYQEAAQESRVAAEALFEKLNNTANASRP